MVHLDTTIQVKALVGLVQACHRLSVDSARRSRRLSGTPLEGALESFTITGAGDDDYMNLPLEHNATTASLQSSTAFMTMDLKALAMVTQPESNPGGGMPEDVVENFLEVVLSFVRDHLGSRPLVTSVAAAAEAGEVKKDERGIQEGFLLLCEVIISFSPDVTIHRVEGSAFSVAPECWPWWSLWSLRYGVCLSRHRYPVRRSEQ